MDLKTYRIWELISLPHYRAVLHVWKKEGGMSLLLEIHRQERLEAPRHGVAFLLGFLPTVMFVHSFLVSLLFSGCCCLHSITRLWFNSCGHVLLAGCSMNWLIPPWERKAMGYG
jgi:hypothetical protein